MRTPNYGALPPSHGAPCPKTERQAMKVLVLHYIEPKYRDFFNSEDLLRELFKHLRRHPWPCPGHILCP